jgi:hypothetical protein
MDDIFEYNDFPVYVDRDELDLYFDHLKLTWFQPITTYDLCMFCNANGSFYNEMLKITICIACFTELHDREIDIDDPKDHMLSKKLRQYVCDWIDKEYMLVIRIDELDENNIPHGLCYVCDKPNDGEYIAISGNGKAIAHETCVKNHGFKNCYSFKEYNHIFDMIDLDDLIDKLGDDPDNIPLMSEMDKEKLSRIVPDIEIDITTFKNFIRLLDANYFKSVEKRTGCHFCRWQCTKYNVDLNMYICDKCLEKLNDNMWNCNTEIGRFVYHYIKDVIKFQCFIERHVDIKYNICQICNRYILKDDRCAVTRYSIAHLECANREGLCCGKIMEQICSRLQ